MVFIETVCGKSSDAKRKYLTLRLTDTRTHRTRMRTKDSLQKAVYDIFCLFYPHSTFYRGCWIISFCFDWKTDYPNNEEDSTKKLASLC